MDLTLYDLRTEYLCEPLGIDAPHPRFAWKLQSAARGVRQTACRLWVTDRDTGMLLWDSGPCATSGSCQRYGGPALASRQRLAWQVEVTACDETGAVATARAGPAGFEMGLLAPGDWQARWVEPEGTVDPEARKPAPCLRREFKVGAGLTRARLYVTAHGLYETWLNGRPVTRDRFTPGLTSYYARIQYQAYDVTELLQPGANCWSARLGDGWWRGVTGGSVKNNFGTKLHFFGQLELTYRDGTRQVVITDEAFHTATGGLLATDMQMGELYDAAREPEGWQYPGFDGSAWQPVHLTGEHADAALIASRSVPVREKETFPARPFRDAEGRLVLDFGQNIAGYVRMTLHNTRPGQQVRLLHGEDIDAAGRFTTANIDKPVLKLPAFQEVIYRCRGAEIETYTPHFAVFGFRYVLLEGVAAQTIRPGDFTAVAVYSDLRQTGDFHCSNPLLNKLVENARWSQKGNYLDVAVDCPTRERNAWTGDNQIYVRTAACFMDVYSFYEKWLQDQALEQYASGKVGITFPSTSSVHDPAALAQAQKTNPTFALAGPTGNGNIGEDCAGWGDAAAWLPYSIYLFYGDRQILENQYETARRWVDYMLACAKEPNPLYADKPAYHTVTGGVRDADWIYDTRMHYGEWQEPIPPDPAKVAALAGKNQAEIFAGMVRRGKPLVATAYMARSAQNVADMAAVLGRTEEAARYRDAADNIRRVYDKYLIGADGTIEPGHQAAYVRALAMDLCSGVKRPAVQAQLVREIEANGRRLNTGFLSTPFLLPVLVEMGRTDLAYALLEQTENPSWLHPVTLGATTIPESWDGFDRHEGSFNHYSYGAVCEFLFGWVAGIRPRWQTPGFARFTLCPVPGGTLTWAEACYESPHGRIVSAWRRQGHTFHYRCEIPANTTADLMLPDSTAHTLGSGAYTFTCQLPDGTR